MMPNRRIAWAFTLVVIAAIVVGGGLAWGRMNRRMRVFDVSVNCSANLRAIGQALQRYAVAYDGPPVPAASWESLLVDGGFIPSNRLVCPVRTDRAFRYRVLNSLSMEPSDGEPFAVMCDEPDAHWEYGGCVLYSNGHARSVEHDEFEGLRAR